MPAEATEPTSSLATEVDTTDPGFEEDVNVERDAREIVNAGDIETFGRFVRLCAGRNGQLLNLSSLANDRDVSALRNAAPHFIKRVDSPRLKRARQGWIQR